jgi:hypothetical protein
MVSFTIRHFTPGETAPVTNEQKARSAPEMVWMLWNKKSLARVGKKAVTS